MTSGVVNRLCFDNHLQGLPKICYLCCLESESDKRMRDCFGCVVCVMSWGTYLNFPEGLPATDEEEEEDVLLVNVTWLWVTLKAGCTVMMVLFLLFMRWGCPVGDCRSKWHWIRGRSFGSWMQKVLIFKVWGDARVTAQQTLKTTKFCRRVYLWCCIDWESLSSEQDCSDRERPVEQLLNVDEETKLTDSERALKYWREL